MDPRRSNERNSWGRGELNCYLFYSCPRCFDKRVKSGKRGMKYRAMKVRNGEPSSLSLSLFLCPGFLFRVSRCVLIGITRHPDVPGYQISEYINVFFVQFLFLVSGRLVCWESLTQLWVHILWQHCDSYIAHPCTYVLSFGGNEENEKRGEGEEEKHKFSSPDYLSHLSKSVGLNSFLQADLGAVLLSPPPQHLALSALQQ